ncbi:MAG: cadherin-like domain-containing protein, partial [Ignavibacteria bacterium]|nr:cadherin-like domain-containing protein [Ignavibacteria bacterium]
MKKNRLKILLLLLLLAAGIILFLLKRTKVPEPKTYPPIISVIPEQVINEGENFKTINLNDYVIDFDGSPTDIKWELIGNKYLKVDLDSRNCLKVYVPNRDWFGTDTIFIRATDSYGLTASNHIVFRVNPVNDPPIISFIPSQIVNEGMDFEEINLNELAKDIDDDNKNLKWSVRGNKELKIEIDSKNKARIIIPDKNWFGEEKIDFTVRDKGGLSSTFTSEFTIRPINDPPNIIQIPSQEINEGEKFNIIDLNNFIIDVDNKIDEIKWSFSGNGELKIIIDENNRAMISTPNENWYGSEQIIFTATDPFGLSAKATVEFRVNPQNDPPMIFEIPSQVIKQEENFQNINLNQFVEDIDDNINSLKWYVEKSSSFDVSIDENNVAQIKPKNENWFGQDTVVFTVSDISGLNASKSVVFKVLEV